MLLVLVLLLWDALRVQIELVVLIGDRHWVPKIEMVTLELLNSLWQNWRGVLWFSIGRTLHNWFQLDGVIDGKRNEFVWVETPEDELVWRSGSHKVLVIDIWIFRRINSYEVSFPVILLQSVLDHIFHSGVVLLTL